MGKNYYDILGVSENASKDDIRKAFRALAKKHHPDRNKGDKAAEDRFKEISEAYEVLDDPKKKEEYDNLRKFGAFQGAGRGGPGFDFSDLFRQGSGGRGGFQTFHFGSGGFEDLSDILSQVFGRTGSPFGGRAGSQAEDPFGTTAEDMFTGRRTRRSSRPQKGRDLKASLTVTFREAIRGTTRKLRLKQTGKTLSVKIPAGIEDGAKIRLAGQGMPGPRGLNNGDLIITVHVMSDQQFERKGNDVYTSTTISFKDAILGCKAQVKTLTTTVSLTVPPGTQPGTRLRLKGQGLALGDTQGDLYVEIKVEIPKTLTDVQRKMLEEWE